MKMKSTTILLATLLAGVMSSGAATMLISNPNDGLADTLYADKNNAPMNSGLVTMGYFSSGITLANVDTISELVANLGSFTIVTSAVPGSASGILGGSFAGYADNSGAGATTVPGGLITVGNPTLLNRSIYSIITSAASLGAATGSSQFALLSLGTFTGDSPFEQNVTGGPQGYTIVIGSAGTPIVGNYGGQGEGTFPTVMMDAIPEPSAALLGALGVLGLIRRRRN